MSIVCCVCRVFAFLVSGRCGPCSPQLTQDKQKSYDEGFDAAVKYYSDFLGRNNRSPY